MKNNLLPRIVAVTALVLVPLVTSARTTVETSAGPLRIEPVLTGLDEPWGLAFLPGGGFVVTERAGRLTLVDAAGRQQVVSGVPQVVDQGQGGLLDVMIPRDFATSREVWLSYAAPGAGEAVSAVGKGRLSDDGTTLEGFTALYASDPMPGGRHFGSRLVEGRDGSVFATIGDRGTGPEGREAQDPARAEGKVIRLARDGAPHALPGLRPGVYSSGHRNPQGATLDAQGNLWLVEHGAMGGDELNRVDGGRNYGWPVISYGVNYDGEAIGTGTDAPGMEQPVHFWDPSIAPSGLMIHSGNGIPHWRGDVFTGSLKFDYISRLDPDDAYAEERIEAAETVRVRDIREAPDGAVWFLSVGQGAVYRMAPDSLAAPGG